MKRMLPIASQRKQSGMTLLELTASLAIGTIIIMGALMLYKSADSSSNSADMIRDMSSMRSGVRSMFVGQVGYGTANINSILVTGGKIPASWTGSGSTITNSFGGVVSITGNTSTFNVTSGSIPKDICVNALPGASQGWLSVGVGATGAAAVTAAIASPISASEAVTSCSSSTQFVAFIGS